MATFLVTGATRGLGLALAEALAVIPGARVVLGVRDLPAGEAVARRLGPHVQARALDLSSLAAVRRFCSDWTEPLAGLVNNAGGQNVGPLRVTEDGFEETVAVNHLAAVELTMGLLPHLAGGRAVFIGSGTHDPGNRTARFFGFRGGLYTTVVAAAAPVPDGVGARQRGLDAYATSKLLNMLVVRALAPRFPSTRFLTLDPGLMPGTGLLRTAPWVAQWFWRTVLRWAVPLLREASTPERSAAAGAWLLTDPTPRTGAAYGADRQPARRLWLAALTDDALAARALDETLSILGR